MAQAAVAHSTVTPIRRDPERDARLARAFFDMESNICDAEHMACIVADLLEDLTDYGRSSVSKDGDVHVFRLTKQDIGKTLFAAYHLHQMVKALKSDFYAATNLP